MRLETRSQIVVVKSEGANKEFNLKEYHDSFLIILEQLLMQQWAASLQVVETACSLWEMMEKVTMGTDRRRQI